MIKNAKPYLIYAVDDDPTIEIVLKAFLPEGCSFLYFSQVIDLEKKIKQQKPDLVIADFRMPDMDGITLKEKLKSLNVILLTGDHSLAGNDDQVLTKPLNKKKLQAMIERARGR